MVKMPCMDHLSNTLLSYNPIIKLNAIAINLFAFLPKKDDRSSR